MKKLLCAILSLGILLSLAGCSLFGDDRSDQEETFPMMDKMQTDFDTIGLILEDATPYYSDRNDLLNTQLGMLYKDDLVKIYFREISGGENWVFTDKGWIYGLYVQTQQSDMGSGDVQDEPYNCYTAEEVLVREDCNYNATVTATYARGQKMFIDALIPGQDGMWGATTEGWVPMCDIIMDAVGVPGMVGMEVVTEVTQRAGPGVEYDAMGVAVPGLVLITDLAESHGILWGQVDGVVWICLDFVQLPGNMKLSTTSHTLFEPDRNRDPMAYYGQGGQDDQGNQGNQGNQSSQGGLTQVPNNTALVGTWTRFDEKEFLKYGWVYGESCTFYPDGSYSSGGCEFMYFPDLGGWYGASGGWGEEGIYTYDGTELKIQVNNYFEPDPDAPVNNRVEVFTYACTVDGDFANWHGSFYRAEDVNEAVRACVRRRAAEKVNTGHVGIWTGDNGDRLELCDDGSFTDSRGSGKYLSIHGRVYLAYSDGYIGLLEFMQDPALSRNYVEDGAIYTVIYTRSK